LSRRTLLAVVLATAAVTLGTAVPGAGPAGATTKYPVPYNFIPYAITGGMNLHEAAPGANDWTCRPSAAHPNPVVLAHGLFGNANTNWQTYAPLLANEGYCVYALTYGVLPNATLPLTLFGGLTPIESSAAEVATFVDRVLDATHAAKVDIVGHSEGTIVPDYYAKFLGGATKIDKYVSLAPLWHGTDSLHLSSLGVPAGASTAAASGSFGQMSPGSPFLAELRSGGTPAVPGITYTNIVTRYDELVSPYTSGIEPGMKNIIVQNQCALDFTEHFEIASDPVAAVDVLNALDPAHPRPVACRLVLPFVGPLVG
jgi:triacylglycerol lipase